MQIQQILTLFKQPFSVIYHGNQYDEEIKKRCKSARPSVCYATKLRTPPLL